MARHPTEDVVEMSLVVNVVNDGGTLGLGAGMSDHCILLTVVGMSLWLEVWHSVSSLRHVSLVAASNTGCGSGDVGVVGAEISVVSTATCWGRVRVDCDTCCTSPVEKEGEREREGGGESKMQC